MFQPIFKSLFSKRDSAHPFPRRPSSLLLALLINFCKLTSIFIWNLVLVYRVFVMQFCLVQIKISAWPVWPNGWVFVYQLSGCGFESCCSHLKVVVFQTMHMVFYIILVLFKKNKSVWTVNLSWHFPIWYPRYNKGIKKLQEQRKEKKLIKTKGKSNVSWKLSFQRWWFSRLPLSEKKLATFMLKQ